MLDLIIIANLYGSCRCSAFNEAGNETDFGLADGLYWAHPIYFDATEIGVIMN